MNTNPERPETEQKDLVRILQERFGKAASCLEVIEQYQQLARSIWNFVAQMLGNIGTRAVMDRAVQLASREKLLVRETLVGNDGLDFTAFTRNVQLLGCSIPDVVDALLYLSVMIFQTLFELTGEALTGPLLRRLEEDK